MRKSFTLLQVYRGIAALLVVLTHGHELLFRKLHQDNLLEIFHFGWIGVDFFFVLSGFIIFYVHQYDIFQPNQFKSFAFKRFVRVYPLYWTILALNLFASLFRNNNPDSIYQGNVGATIKAVLLLPQDRYILDQSFLGFSWTLSYEIFFYCIIGLLILFPTKIIKPIIYVWIICTILNLLNLLPIGENFLIKFIFNDRNLEFALGSLAAYTISKYKFKYGMLLIYASGTMLILSIINTNYHEYYISGVSPLIAYGIPFTLLIIGSVYIEGANQMNIPPILVYIGNASYSIYLTHSLFLDITSTILTKLADKTNILHLIKNIEIYNYTIAYIVLAVSIAMGCVVHSYIEKPLITNIRKKVFAKVN